MKILLNLVSSYHSSNGSYQFDIGELYPFSAYFYYRPISTLIMNYSLNKVFLTVPKESIAQIKVSKHLFIFDTSENVHLIAENDKSDENWSYGLV